MCGIFGIVGKRSREIEAALSRGTRALAHRGPDDEGTEFVALASDPGTYVGLGNRRLAILDLSPAGHQPMLDPATGNTLIFNGEIYNFQDLRVELEKLGHRFTSGGDTEVLLKAYGQWGEACLKRLVGMFAFAVWDSRRERLFIARDRLGEKPLYYYDCPGLFMFASELRSLLATGIVPRRLDMQGLASFLAFGSVQDPLTIIEDVASLLPGHTLTWEKSCCRTQKYWDVAEVASRTPATHSRQEAIDGIHRHLLQAVLQRLISDVPLGIFLSGGIDSSCVVALASEVSSKPLDSFSVVFGGSDLCESAYSDHVAKTFGCRHHQIQLTEADLLDDLPGALDAMDEPTIDGINSYVISRATKKAGVTVALSGLGGDEIFAGYSSFRSVPKMMSFQHYAQRLKPLRTTLGPLLVREHTNRLSKAFALAAAAHLGNHPYFVSRALFLPRTVEALLPQGSHENFDLASALDLRGLEEGVRGLDPINQVSVLEGSTYMANTLLRDTDCMSMAHALEVRTPLLHHPLWEYVLPLAGCLKLDPQLPKPLLLSAAGQRLPEEIYRRRKMGFTLPFEVWMRDGLKGELEQELLGNGANEHFPVDARQGARIWKAFLARKTSWSRPWALFVLKQWIRRNIGT
jgi:asparagine synthase (glutamine-hydrolysing)